ncbi:MFS transporter [Pelagicoccus sp. SDUM812003]|uniref:MFS transporter n=1 Tax=Pelagicoccus sp. SDUM812003 TaxID=3041267 RepID=UPI0028103AE9|nr:MFS transporter [Pelagicoccus sp. SDUM812003]MDQ8204065.1 MFS transporter [Pelagicoccus sp. SDUM812003]
MQSTASTFSPPPLTSDTASMSSTSQLPSASPSNGKELRVWLTLFLVTLISSSQSSFSIIGLPMHAKSIGFSASQLSLLLGAFPFCAAVSAIVNGPVSDFYGRKRALLLGLISLGITLSLHPFATTFETLLFLRACAGFSAGLLTGLPSLLLSDSFGRERQQPLIGRSLSGYAIGQTIAIPLGIALIDLSGYLALNAYLGILALVLAPFARQLLPSATHRYQSPNYSFKRYGQETKTLFRNKRFRGLIATSGISFVATSLFYVTFAQWLFDDAGLRPYQIAPMYILAGLAQVFALAYMSQRNASRAPEKNAAISFLVNAVLFSLFLIAFHDLRWAAFLFALSLGAIALRIPSIHHLLNLSGPDTLKGLRMSMAQSCNHLGRAIGVSFASLLFPVVSADLLMLAAGLALLPSAAFFALSRPIDGAEEKSSPEYAAKLEK